MARTVENSTDEKTIGSDQLIIENYSYVKCPDCGKEIKVFGESHVEEAAREMNVPVLGRMPIDMKLAEAVENEKFYEAENPYLADVKL